MSTNRAVSTPRARLTNTVCRFAIPLLAFVTACDSEYPLSPRREGIPPAVRINEIVTAGAASTGWVELYNPTTSSIDLSGWTIIDDTIFGPVFTVQPRTVIAPGGFVRFEERAFPFGIDAVDDIRLMSPFGVEVDRMLWLVPRP